MHTPCKCEVKRHNSDYQDEVIYCPLHAAAPELLEAAKAAYWLRDAVNYSSAICKGNPPCFIRDDYPQPDTTQGIIMYCPLHAAALGMRDVLQKVVTHFDGTDSPLGQEASVLLREIGGKEVE